MSVSADILRSYRQPRVVMRGLLAMGPREDRALVFLAMAIGIGFLAQWPRMAEMARAAPDAGLSGFAAGEVMAIIIQALFAYGLAALVRLGAKVFRGRGSWFGERLALFWAMLATSPLMLVWGAVYAIFGPGMVQEAVSWIVLAAFLWIWIGGIRAVEGRAE